MITKEILVYSFIGIAISLASCKNESDKDIECCQNPIIESIYNVKVSYIGNGMFKLLDSINGVKRFGTLSACSFPDSLKKSESDTIPNYIISGHDKGYCYPFGVWEGPKTFEITNLKTIF